MLIDHCDALGNKTIECVRVLTLRDTTAPPIIYFVLVDATTTTNWWLWYGKHPLAQSGGHLANVATGVQGTVEWEIFCSRGEDSYPRYRSYDAHGRRMIRSNHETAVALQHRLRGSDDLPRSAGFKRDLSIVNLSLE